MCLSNLIQFMTNNQIITLLLVASILAIVCLSVCLLLQTLSRRRGDSKEMSLAQFLSLRHNFIGGQLVHFLGSERSVVGQVADIFLTPPSKSSGHGPSLRITLDWAVVRRADNSLEAAPDWAKSIEILWPEQALVLDRCKVDNLRYILLVPRGVQGFLSFSRNGAPSLSRERAFAEVRPAA